jgi:hypothetical protein
VAFISKTQPAWVALTIFLSVFVAGPLFAQDSGCTPVSNGSDQGLMAYIDPETGELTSSPSPGQQLPDAPAQEPPEPVQEVQPDGSVLMRMDERHMHTLQADISSGKLITCHGADGQDGHHDQP